jgi:hypothetical protein
MVNSLEGCHLKIASVIPQVTKEAFACCASCRTTLSRPLPTAAMLSSLSPSSEI